MRTASGGRQALQCLKEENFNLLLGKCLLCVQQEAVLIVFVLIVIITVDVMMPDMDGLSLIRVFKQATTQDIPTISKLLITFLLT